MILRGGMNIKKKVCNLCSFVTFTETLAFLGIRKREPICFFPRECGGGPSRNVPSKMNKISHTQCIIQHGIKQTSISYLFNQPCIRNNSGDPK